MESRGESEYTPLTKEHQPDVFFGPQRRALRWDGVYCALLGLTLIGLGLANFTVSTFADSYTVVAGIVVTLWAALLLFLSRLTVANWIVGGVAGVNLPAAAAVAGLGINSYVNEALAVVVAVQIAAFAVHQVYVVLTAKV